MRNWLRYIMCLAIMTTALQAWSRTWSVPEVRDTVFFYKTWQQILDNSPEGMLIEPDVFVLSDTPYDLAILTPDEDFNRALLKDYIAASQGDSIWVISSEYLKANFGGDVKYLNGFLSCTLMTRSLISSAPMVHCRLPIFCLALVRWVTSPTFTI